MHKKSLEVAEKMKKKDVPLAEEESTKSPPPQTDPSCYGDKDQIRSNSIASLRAKAIEHASKILGHTGQASGRLSPAAHGEDDAMARRSSDDEPGRCSSPESSVGCLDLSPSGVSSEDQARLMVVRQAIGSDRGSASFPAH